MVASDFDQGIIWGERALKLAEKFGDEEVMVATLNTVGVCRLQKGEEESGLDALRESLHRSLELNYQFEVTRAYYNLGECLRFLSRHEEARILYEEYLDYTQQLASRSNEQIVMTQLVQLDWRCGRWGEAICNRAIFKNFPIGIFRIWANTAEGWMENDLGRPEATLELLEGLLSDVLDTGEKQTIAPFLGQLARAYAAIDMDRETKDTLQLLLEHLNRVSHFDWNSTMPLLFACRWFASRSDAESLEASRECASRLEEESDLQHIPMIGAAIAEASGLIAWSEKEGAQAVDCLQDAVGRWEALGLPYDQARALETLGRALTLTEDLEAASVAYDQAYELIQMLADQLEDDELRDSFMASQLVEGIQQGRMSSSSHIRHP
jgi:tetratricopeptide (TPR) repeat protein